MNLHFEQLYDNETSTLTYCVANMNTKEAALFDTVQGHEERYVSILKRNGFNLKYLFETHVHADHITAISRILKKFPAAVVLINENSGVNCTHRGLKDGEIISLGNIDIKVFATPGHTKESMSFLVDGQRLLTGDTLFIGSCGRTDFQAGSPEDMYNSLQKLTRLPDDVLVYPGHDYNNRRVSTISEQKLSNKLLSMTFAEFKTELVGWNLPPPKRINEAVPANLMCGAE